jgi:hypothetical protein
MNSSFCKECRKKCKFFDSDSDSEESLYSSDTSSEYYRDSSNESTELPIDLTGLSISDSSDGSTDESTNESTNESSDIPIDMSKLSMSDDSDDSDKRKRKRGSTVSESSDYTSDLTDYTTSSSDFDLNKLSLKETEGNQPDEDKLSQLLTGMFVSKKEPTEDNLDYLTSNLSRLRVSPKKKRKSTNKPMDIDEEEDVPIKQRLRKSIKKPMSSGKFKIIPRETWTSKSES